MFRIKHIPTGLYYQPLKHGGNTLSRKGKVYHKKTSLKVCSVVIGIGWSKPIISKELERWLSKNWDDIKQEYTSRSSHSIVIPSQLEDWEHEEIVL